MPGDGARGASSWRDRVPMLDEERVFDEHGFFERVFPLSTVWIEHLFVVNRNPEIDDAADLGST